MKQIEPLRVSDHCILRYLERAMGLNIEIVRGHIAGICEGAAGIGATCVRSEGLRFEIATNVVTTVTSDGQSPNKTSRAKNQRKIKSKMVIV